MTRSAAPRAALLPPPQERVADAPVRRAETPDASPMHGLHGLVRLYKFLAEKHQLLAHVSDLLLSRPHRLEVASPLGLECQKPRSGLARFDPLLLDLTLCPRASLRDSRRRAVVLPARDLACSRPLLDHRFSLALRRSRAPRAETGRARPRAPRPRWRR